MKRTQMTENMISDLLDQKSPRDLAVMAFQSTEKIRDLEQVIDVMSMFMEFSINLMNNDIPDGGAYDQTAGAAVTRFKERFNL